MTSPLLLTAEDVARELNIGRTRVFELLRSGHLRSVKVGKSRRVSRAALEEFVVSLESSDPLGPTTPHGNSEHPRSE